ncbi:gag-pol polyprotein, partial [Trifolium medium]|nr:gag-pol polyprotein [Trifolium medium]
KAIAEEAIRGLPKLKIEEGKTCGECQIGKQTKVAHSRLQHQVTSKTLELLHMESANVVIDDSPSTKKEDVEGDAEPSIDLTDGTV